MKFEDIKTGEKVAVRIIAVVPNKIDGYVESIGKGEETLLGRPKKVKSVKKGTVIFKIIEIPDRCISIGFCLGFFLKLVKIYHFKELSN